MAETTTTRFLLIEHIKSFDSKKTLVAILFLLRLRGCLSISQDSMAVSNHILVDETVQQTVNFIRAYTAYRLLVDKYVFSQGDAKQKTSLRRSRCQAKM